MATITIPRPSQTDHQSSVSQNFSKLLPFIFYSSLDKKVVSKRGVCTRVNGSDAWEEQQNDQLVKYTIYFIGAYLKKQVISRHPDNSIFQRLMTMFYG